MCPDSSNSSKHEPIRFLEEFVCTAIPGPWYQRMHARGSDGADEQTPKPESTGEERTGDDPREANENGDQDKSL